MSAGKGGSEPPLGAVPHPPERDAHELDELEHTVALAGIGLWRLDLASRRVETTAELARRLGGDEPFAGDLDGFLALIHPDDRAAVADAIDRVRATGGPAVVDHRPAHPALDGWLRLHLHGVRDATGAVVRIRGACRDVDGGSEPDGELRDPLTGLLTRAAFRSRLEAATARQDGEVVVGLLDIDAYGAINQRYGSEVADEALRRFADRLRESVPADGVVARTGSDEFGILLEPTAARGDRGAELVTTLTAITRRPLRTAEQLLRVSVSGGVATGRGGVASAEILLRDAGLALQLAKGAGGGCVRRFDEKAHRGALEELTLQADLERAVAGGEVAVHYQPIVSLATGRLVGVEALARWDRPGHGPVAPEEFIPLAERAGLLGEVFATVLRTATREVHWLDELAGDEPLSVAVNVGASQLDDPEVLDLVTAALEETGLDPARLVLEITEGAVTADAPTAVLRLTELRRLGCRIAIDDFGTGYSSLSRLRDFPVDLLKIDRSFLHDVDGERRAVLTALCTMARGLGLRAIAEGVETPEQLAAVLEQGCDEVQGFLLSRPVPLQGIEHLLTDPAGDHDPEVYATLPPRPAPTDDPLAAALTDAVTRGGDLGDLLDELLTLTGLESAYLTRLDPGGGRQVVVAARNRGALKLAPGLEVDWDTTVCRRALRDGHRYLADAAATYPDSIASELGIRAYVTVPVVGADGRLQGTLCVASSSPRPVAPSVLDVLGAVARLLADRLTDAA